MDGGRLWHPPRPPLPAPLASACLFPCGQCCRGTPLRLLDLNTLSVGPFVGRDDHLVIAARLSDHSFHFCLVATLTVWLQFLTLWSGVILTLRLQFLTVLLKGVVLTI